MIMAVILVSCVTPPITMDGIQTIRRGIDYERFKSIITRKPRSTFSIQHKGLSYSIEIYPMQTGTETQYIWIYSESGGYLVPTSVPISEDYVFIFDDDGLIFWGFLNECHKEGDELVQQLAPLISEQYEKETINQKPSAERGQ